MLWEPEKKEKYMEIGYTAQLCVFLWSYRACPSIKSQDALYHVLWIGLQKFAQIFLKCTLPTASRVSNYLKIPGLLILIHAVSPVKPSPSSLSFWGERNGGAGSKVTPILSWLRYWCFTSLFELSISLIQSQQSFTFSSPTFSLFPPFSLLISSGFSYMEVCIYNSPHCPVFNNWEASPPKAFSYRKKKKYIPSSACIIYVRWRQHLVNHSSTFSCGETSRGGQRNTIGSPVLCSAAFPAPQPSHKSAYKLK